MGGGREEVGGGMGFGSSHDGEDDMEGDFVWNVCIVGGDEVDGVFEDIVEGGCEGVREAKLLMSDVKCLRTKLLSCMWRAALHHPSSISSKERISALPFSASEPSFCVQALKCHNGSAILLHPAKEH
eukprot:14945254-Ditylum_brightwellii.AAC.1